MKMTIKIKQIGVCAGMATLMMAWAWLNTACSSDEAIVENKPAVEEKTTPTETTVKFTATLAPKGDNGSGTRAITTGKDSNNKEILNVAWQKDEHIAMCYQTGPDSYANATATVGEPNSDGSAPISATLESAMDGGWVRFVYPASLANTKGDINETKLLYQHGNLTARTTPNASVDDISTCFDAATSIGTLDVNAGQAVVSSKVTMHNRVCICKFKFSLDDGTSSIGSIGVVESRTFDNLKIYDCNGHVYTIKSDRPYDNTSVTRGFKENEDIYVAMLPVSSKPVIFHYEQTALIGKDNYIKYAPSTTLEAGKFYRNLNLTLTKEDHNGVHTFKDLSAGNITAANGDIIYQSSAATANTITIPDDATVTLVGVNISATGSAGIICEGTANIRLNGSNSVTSTAENYPAIQAGDNTTTLTISGDGSLYAKGGKYGAGIGGGYVHSCGNITINGGNITASGGESGAGIGNGLYRACGNITINGGTITAKGGEYGAGIGTGSGYGSEEGSTCGDIIINGGTVNATGGYNAAGIGSGYKGKCGDITIRDGTVTAIGDEHAAGIGSGYKGKCGDISISGGTVTATGGSYAAGIGSGENGKYTSISIGRDITKVKATSGGVDYAPIGKGRNDQDSGNVTIDGTTGWTAGTATTNLNFAVSANGTTWTLTPKQ